MNEAETFKAFFDSIKLDSLDEYQATIDSISHKLRSAYYEEEDKNEYGIIVGSVGRGTAVSGTSDLDMLFVLPKSVYKRFDSYDSNGQPALLQEIRGVLKEKYPKTDIRGDGQAVVIRFTNRKFTVDLVPAFPRSDGAFDFPDSRDGGSWKKTNPIPEQKACEELCRITDGVARSLCNSLRIWKNNIGLKFKGLLIDTLVGNYLENKDKIANDPYDCFISLFEFLLQEDREKSYWHAIGSNQRIFNDNHGAFIPKAKEAVALLSNVKNDGDRERALVNLFGKAFSDCIADGLAKAQESTWKKQYGADDKEMFIEDMFAVNISHAMSIDCEVTQKGFRPHNLREMLASGFPLLRSKQLQFYTTEESLPDDCQFYWKVKNRGEEAYRRNCLRGAIVQGKQSGTWCEHTDFVGPHYVECYAIKDGVCIARSRIDVPIVDGQQEQTWRAPLSALRRRTP